MKHLIILVLFIPSISFARWGWFGSKKVSEKAKEAERKQTAQANQTMAELNAARAEREKRMQDHLRYNRQTAQQLEVFSDSRTKAPNLLKSRARRHEDPDAGIDRMRRNNIEVRNGIDAQLKFVANLLQSPVKLAPEKEAKLKALQQRMINLRAQVHQKAEGNGGSLAQYQQAHREYSKQYHEFAALNREVHGKVGEDIRRMGAQEDNHKQLTAALAARAAGQVQEARQNALADGIRDLYVDHRINGISMQMALRSIGSVATEQGISQDQILDSIRNGEIKKSFENSALGHYIDAKTCEALTRCGAASP